MDEVDLSIVVGGPQGGGIDTASSMIGRAFVYSGYDVLSVREFHSNIKGRHSYVHLRVKNGKARSLKFPVDILVALDPGTIFEHSEDVSKGTRVVYDSDFEDTELSQSRMIMRDTSLRIGKMLESKGLPLTTKGMLEYMKSKGATLVPMSFRKIVSDATSEGTPVRYFNTFGAAITLAVLGIEKEFMDHVIRQLFSSKEYVVEPNLKVVAAAYEYSKENKLQLRALPKLPPHPKMILTGNEASAMGKVIGGLRFQTYYPITPASDESEALEEHQDLVWIKSETGDLAKGGVAVIQTEDEISAVTMAMGAAMTGARSSTATSGPGFSLMAEGISFAGMDEIPLLITLYQRGGPSTGLPTRNGQGDLLFAIHAGHGEFPKIVVSSGDVAECIEDAARALGYAQRYQVPVIHLIDKNLANTSDLVDPVNEDEIKIVKAVGNTGDHDTFNRYSLDTETGISPMGNFGKDIFWMTGDEHDERGHVTEDTRMREKQMEKRFAKIVTAEKEIPIGERVQVIGPKDADVTFVTWGSQKGVLLDVMDLLSRKGIKTNLLYLKMFSPFPSEFVTDFLSSAKMVIDVESNMTAQATSVIEANTCHSIEKRILKYNGRHITEDELYDAALKIINGEEQKVVLKNGA